MTFQSNPVRAGSGAGRWRWALAAGLAVILAAVAFPAAGKRARPDLVVRSVGAPPTAIDAGTTISVSDVTRNVGSKKAGASQTGYYLSLDGARGNDIRLTGRRRVKALRPGKRSRGGVVVGVPDSVPLGSYRVLACADDTRAIAESHEANNCRAAAGATQVFPPGVFVSGQGHDSDAGTRAAPMLTVQAAIGAAAAQVPPGEVFVAEGSYGPVELATGVGIHGGFDAATWGPSPFATDISGGPQAVTVNGVSGVTLSDLSIAGVASGGSAYGIRALDSSIALERVEVSAGDGADGGVGSTPPGSAVSGADGARGDPGVEDSTMFCDSNPRPAGGLAGTSGIGRPGGKGGQPGKGANGGDTGLTGGGPAAGAGGTGVPAGGNPALAVYVGDSGGAGAPGPDGAPGSGSFLGAGYAPADGGDGGQGAAGSGGGGGGGGGGGSTDCDSWGGGGGGGGAGGAGGGGGGGGASGGASIALYLWNSTVSGETVSLTTANGGAGGTGAGGQAGGQGGAGGPSSLYGGSSSQDDATNGAAGGAGGDGGDGGNGGAGAGGPSIGAVLGNGSALTGPGITFSLGLPGPGGPSPGNAGPAGFVMETYTP